ncbi:hypothetical protein T484DRAFT_1901000, partial [Baffinella frigidus]
MGRPFAHSLSKNAARRDGRRPFSFLPLLSLAGAILAQLIAETGCDAPKAGLAQLSMRSSGPRRWSLALRAAPQLSGAHTGLLDHGRPALEVLRGGGLIKKKSKEKHALRKKQKNKGLWWIKDKDLVRPDRNAALKDAKLFEACRAGSASAVEAAIEGGANIQARRREQGGGMLLATPLHVAAYYGSLEAVKALIDFKAKIDGVDATKKTPLHYAATQGFPEICDALITAGAAVHAEDMQGYTPLDDAESASFDTVNARKVLQKAGALRHGAHSVLNEPGWGGQKARNAPKEADSQEEDAAMPGSSADDGGVRAAMGDGDIKRGTEWDKSYKDFMEQKWGPGASKKHASGTGARGLRRGAPAKDEVAGEDSGDEGDWSDDGGIKERREVGKRKLKNLAHKETSAKGDAIKVGDTPMKYRDTGRGREGGGGFRGGRGARGG